MSIRTTVIALCLLCCTCVLTEAQEPHRQKHSVNFGLRSPQPEETLPKGKGKVSIPQRKEKTAAVTSYLSAGKDSWALREGWEMCEGGLRPEDWYNATVPGTVLTTLVQQGVYPDPRFGLNNLSIPDDLCRKDWWYRCSFSVPEQARDKEVFELIFNGINYKADIWLNGHKIGRMEGAFIRGRFDITSLLQPVNELYVHILPPSNPGIPHEQSPSAGGGWNGGALCLDGPTFICSEGWDWMPGVRDRNIGIWQDVVLHASEGLTIGDTKVVTDLPLPDLSYADITVSTTVCNRLDRDRTVTLCGEIDGMRFSKEAFIPAGKETDVRFGPLRIENPRLWMPNGYGEQNLYTLSLKCLCGEEVSDTKDVSFGVRELSYELTADTSGGKGRRLEYNPVRDNHLGAIFDNRMLRDTVSGVQIPSLRSGVPENELDFIANDGMSPYIVIKVNGTRIFCKGGNWGMDDMMKNVSREHLEPYFKLHKEANFNMIRNWTGASTSENFYQLCDEYGMLVWNDFWISTEGFNLDPLDEDLFIRNATDVVRRFFNHPSIAVWCPRNEGYATESLERRLAGMIIQEDCTRHYHPNSRHCNLRPSGPWHYYKDAAQYYRNDAFGFNTELGSPSVPTAATMRKMMPEEDLWPISDTWHYHDLLNGLKDYVQAVDRLYGEAVSLEDFCRKVQFINYDSYRAMFESWNSRLWNNTSGVLLWMSHPAWPSVEWQTYSWDYETFGSYYGSKKACEPLHIQMNLHDRKVIMVNTTGNTIGNVNVRLSCHDIKGRTIRRQEAKGLTMTANSKTEVFTADTDGIEGVYLVRIRMTDNKGRLISENDYLMRGKGTEDFKALGSVAQAKLKAKVLRPSENGSRRIEISNCSPHTAYNLKMNLVDRESGEIILPAYFSDGYFHLLPGEKKIVEFTCQEDGAVSIEGYNVDSHIIVR